MMVLAALAISIVRAWSYLILKVCSYGLDHQHPRAELRPRPLDRSRGGVFSIGKTLIQLVLLSLNCHLGEDIEMSWLFVDEFPKRCVHV
jgi:hypothetical protein